MDSPEFSLTLSSMALTAELFSLSLPAKHEVNGWTPTARNVSGVHSECARVGTVALAVAAAASWSSRSWLPLIGSTAILVFLTLTYSSAARAGGLIEPPAAPPNTGRFT